MVTKTSHILITIYALLALGQLSYSNEIVPNDRSANRIKWSENVKLVQSDFKSKKKHLGINTAAITATSFGFEITNINGSITGSIYVEFFSSDSWWNPKMRNIENKDFILKHEQLHFDICELYGRKLYKEILKLKKKNSLNSKTIEKLYKNIEKEYKKFQDKYDAETNHSINKTAQLRWNELIDKKLNEYKKYKNYHSF